MVTLQRAELDYLLEQVTINYRDAAGNPAAFNYTALTSALDARGIREVNGANNNLVGHGDLPGSLNTPGTPGDFQLWGTADSPFLNLSIGQASSSAANTAYNIPSAPVTDGAPRLISNLISTMYTSVPAAPFTDASFETQSLATGAPGVFTNIALGNYTMSAPAGWSIDGGQGGLYAPNWTISRETGHGGTNVVWLSDGATLAQDGPSLVAGATYNVSLKIGDRTDLAFGGGTARIVAVDTATNTTTVLATQSLVAPANGEWSTITLDTGAITSALAGQTLRVEVQQGGGSNQVLVDDVTLTSTGTNAYANPAVLSAAQDFGGGVIDPNDPNGTAFIPDPGVLGGARFNQWFTAFGQFFDHGLDFIIRDPASTAKISITLSPNDPLYSLGADGIIGGTGPNRDTTSITVTRAGVANVADAGADNTFGTADDVINKGADGIVGGGDDTLSGTSGTYAKPIYTNNTGLLIDQSQTYGSVASVNAILREYDANGRPTGRVVTSNTDAITNGDLADDGNAKGLETWADVKLNAARIGVQLVNADVLNAPMLRVDPAGKLLFTPDGGPGWTTDSIWDMSLPQAADDPFVRDAVTGAVLKTNHAFLLDMGFGANPLAPGFDPAVLDAYYISGDGRVNENIGLTAVHEVFHTEHNLNVANVKASVQTEADAITAGGGDGLAYLRNWQIEVTPGNWQWDGEKLFQAARIITEQEYNHIAVAEYIRSLQPSLPEFVSYSTDINLGVSLEFSQAVFRLGHSMLTETFNVTDPNTGQNLKLLDAFLNPELYDEIGAANLALGLAKTYANMPDEFVTPALQQSLLGQPLDLAAINIARGRDVGLPTLNELRQQVYDQIIQNTNNANESAIAPYTSWSDFGAHLNHPQSLVNFIAAYARGGDPLGDAIVAARAAYMAGTATLDDVRAAAQRILDAAADASDPDHAAALHFMGGAPQYNTTTGQWGFEQGDQGFWDIDLWIGGLAERPLFDGPLGTTFSFVMLDFAQRMQDGDRFYYLYRMPFSHPIGIQVIAEQFTDVVARTLDIDYFGSAFGTADARFVYGAGDDFHDNSQHEVTFVDGTVGPASDGHTVIGGGAGNDYLIAGLGDDVVYGDEGNDFIQGSQGNDYLLGGDGDDYITDDENDDHIRGGAGNDKLFAGPGVLDLVLGEEGDDEVHGGTGIDEVYGGDGDDLVFGDGDTDKVFGEDGNDYVEGGDGPDEMFGGKGNDWLRGGVGDDSLQGESGNDLLEGGLGPTANNGDVLIGDQPVGPIGTETFLNQGEGFDIASYEDANVAVSASLNENNIVRQGGLLDTYTLIEGLVGTRFNDELTGATEGNAGQNQANNYLVGGGGDDRLAGLGGDDLIVGDQLVVTNDLTADFSGAYTAVADWKGLGEIRAQFADARGLGHVLGDNGTVGTADVAIFRGNRSDYIITANADGSLTVADQRDPAALVDEVTGENLHDGTDTLVGIELMAFADGTISTANNPPSDIQWNGVTPNNSNLPVAGQIIANLAASDVEDTAGFTFGLVSPADGSFQITAGGIVSKTAAPMAINSTYTLQISVTDTDGGVGTETFEIKTGSDLANIIAASTTNDVIYYGDDGNDQLSGGAGNDTLFGQDEDDTLTGGGGNDALHGGTGDTDTAVFSGPWTDYTFATSPQGVVVSDGVASRDGSDTLADVEQVRFADPDGTGTVLYRLTTGSNGNQSNLQGSNSNSVGDLIFGFGGNDNINARNGNDTIAWRVGDGVDNVNGGSGTDTFFAFGDATAEVFGIYTRDAAADAFGYDGDGEIVITRNGLDAASIIAALENVEEIVINGMGGGDEFVVEGNFDNTSLLTNTITLHGGADDDTVNISGLASSHRVVFHANGGSDRVIGDDRPQDVMDTAGGGTVTYATVPSGSSTGSGTGGSTSGAGGSVVTGHGHTLAGTSGSDVMIGSDDNKVIHAGHGDDIVTAGDTKTVILAGDGADVVDGGGAGDIIFGGGDRDIIDGLAGDDKLFGGDGDDLVHGGHGADMLFGDAGADELHGGFGHDRIEGGHGADLLFGEEGDDQFTFRSAADAHGDTIADLQSGDVIDLSFIDASDTSAGNGSFSILSANAFTAAGQLIVHFDASKNATIVEGNTDGNTTTAEFSFVVDGDHVTALIQNNGHVIV